MRETFDQSVVVEMDQQIERELEAGKESCQLGRVLQVAQTLGLVVSVSTRRELRL